MVELAWDDSRSAHSHFLMSPPLRRTSAASVALRARAQPVEPQEQRASQRSSEVAVLRSRYGSPVVAAPVIEELEAEIADGLAQLIEVQRAEIDALLREREALDQKINARQRKLRSWETARTSLGTAAQKPALQLVAAAPPTKREAVLAFLAESSASEHKLIDIRRALLARGWMLEAEVHALEVAVAEMARRGEIGRPRKGVYRLRPHEIEGMQ